MSHHTLVSAAFLAVFTTSGVAAQKNIAPVAAQPLTRASFIATMDSEYRKLDANRDQIVTRNEIEANQRARQAEAAARSARDVFAKIDGDRNGQVSVDEFVRANTQQIRPADGTAIMNRLDTNRDRKVTLVEYRILTLSNFDGIDTDRDGVLTAAEQRASTITR